MVRRSLLSKAAYALVLLAPLCGVARADVVHLKDGKKVEGKILKDTPAGIELETKFGKIMIERITIDHIETKRLPAEEFKFRLREAGNDEDKLWEVAEYAKAQRLKEEYETALLRIVDANPKHKDANLALGRVYFRGEWYPPEVAERLKAEYEQEMIAAGKVFYDGEWRTPEAAKRMQGYEQYEGEWVLIPELYKKKSAKLAPQLLGVELLSFESAHYQLRMPSDDDMADELLKLLERQYDDFMATFKLNPVEQKIMVAYPIVVYVLPTADIVPKFIEAGGYMDQIYNPPKGFGEKVEGEEVFPLYFPRPLIVLSFGRHLVGGSTSLSLRGFLTMYNANVLLHRFTRNHRIPGWVDAGYTAWGEAKYNEYRTLTVIDKDESVPWDDTFNNYERWYKYMSDAEFRAKLPSIAVLREKRAEVLTTEESVKSYFLVAWLMKTRPDAFVEYARGAYEQYEITSDLVRPEETAFDEAFGMAPAEFDRQFEAWAQSIQPTPKMD
jgi:hypothetical protein